MSEHLSENLSETPRSQRWRRLGVVTVVAASTVASVGVTAASGAVPAASSSASPASRPAPAKPTIVFVHGAFADSSGFDSEIRTLRRLGYPVLAAPDPLRTVSGDADSVRALLATVAGPVVLVGHSYGGAVITNAAVGAPNVKALVYLGAFIPDAGQSINDIQVATPGSLLGPATTRIVPFADPSMPGGQNADIYVQADQYRAVIAADVDARTAADMAVTQRPLALSAQLGPSGPPAWKTVPSWDLITLDDRAIPAAAQRAMAARAGAHVETVHSSHAVMVSHPKAVVDIILDAAKAAAGH
ncbi:alpha/beta hydrolase [Catenulispora yoronensis]|uniref:Alpha/beta hydrolase n=1 Tax=Catenulispora yoronensis TaxID=450799 RepID=A0ABN2V4A5_9ACTN